MKCESCGLIGALQQLTRAALGLEMEMACLNESQLLAFVVEKAGVALRAWQTRKARAHSAESRTARRRTMMDVINLLLTHDDPETGPVEVQSHRAWKDRILITIEGKTATVMAADMIRAIQNATNS